MKLRFLILAQRELDDVVAWYNEQAAGLGQEFLDELGSQRGRESFSRLRVSVNPILDEIDRVLAAHYGFTDEELAFIPSTQLRVCISTFTTRYRANAGGGTPKFAFYISIRQ